MVVDVDGTYAEWFEEAVVETVVVRPDFYVYGTAPTMEKLPLLVSSLQSSLLYNAASETLHQVREEG